MTHPTPEERLLNDVMNATTIEEDITAARTRWEAAHQAACSGHGSGAACAQAQRADLLDAQVAYLTHMVADLAGLLHTTHHPDDDRQEIAEYHVHDVTRGAYQYATDTLLTDETPTYDWYGEGHRPHDDADIVASTLTCPRCATTPTGIAVLAASWLAVHDWANRRGDDPARYHHVSDAHHLRGLSAVVVLDGWAVRRTSTEIQAIRDQLHFIRTTGGTVTRACG